MVGKLAQRVVRQSAVDDVTSRRERTAFDHAREHVCACVRSWGLRAFCEAALSDTTARRLEPKA